MTHFFHGIVIPEDTKDIEKYVAKAMAPYNEEIQPEGGYLGEWDWYMPTDDSYSRYRDGLPQTITVQQFRESCLLQQTTGVLHDDVPYSILTAGGIWMSRKISRRAIWLPQDLRLQLGTSDWARALVHLINDDWPHPDPEKTLIAYYDIHC